MTDLNEKALEAAAMAVYEQRPHQYWDHSEQTLGWVTASYSEVDEGWRELATKQASAAIRAYLSALVQDEAAVEAVARAIWEKEGFIDGDFDGPGDPFRRVSWDELIKIEADYCPTVHHAREQARAALSALANKDTQP